MDTFAGNRKDDGRCSFPYTTGMNRRSLIFICALVVGVFLIGRAAHAEEITSFSVRLTTDADAVLDVEETIVYDFGSEEHHGIFRTITTQYERSGLNYRTRLHVVSVAEHASGSETFADVPHTLSSENGNAVLRIGDPDVTVTGLHTYRLRYRMERAINWFDGEPEVYWNVTGTEWTVPIRESDITLSAHVPLDAKRTECFTGVFGSQESLCTISQDGGDLLVSSTMPLFAGEGLTVVTRLPAGSIPEPTATERALATLRDNWGFGLPVLTFVALLYLYRRYGRDPAGRGTIIAEYEPPEGLSPAMVGYVIDEEIHPQDISAAMLNLAVKGRMTIQYEKKKLFGHTYRLTKRTPPANALSLSPFEQVLADEIFAKEGEVKLEDLKKTLPTKLGTLKETLRTDAKSKKVFAREPETVRRWYYGIGGVLLLGTLITLGGAIAAGSGAIVIGMAVSGILFLAFARAMPSRTEHGVRIREQVEGFKQFLTVTEKDRLEFHNAPEKTSEQFFAFLPYAVALDVATTWAKQFRDVTIEKPDWYGGQDFSTFNAMVFASSMSDFSNTAKSQAFTAPSKGAGSGGSGFGGGGFSGGGFGGGGGGSW